MQVATGGTAAVGLVERTGLGRTTIIGMHMTRTRFLTLVLALGLSSTAAAQARTAKLSRNSPMKRMQPSFLIDCDWSRQTVQDLGHV